MTKSIFLGILFQCFLFVFSINAQEKFSKTEQDLIFAQDSSQSMQVWKINNKTELSLLRSKSEEIKIKDYEEEILYFVNRLYKTVRNPNSLGVGIAAPQVGILKRIIWVQRFDKEKENYPFEYYLNPKIIEYSEDKKRGAEGCLSIPEQRVNILRSVWIVIEYQTIDGEWHQEKITEAFTARIFQHEIDHLDGILCIDY